jgi:hypothetical protein
MMTDKQRHAFNLLPAPEKLAILDEVTHRFYAEPVRPCGRSGLCTCDRCGSAIEDLDLVVARERRTAAKGSGSELEDATTEADHPAPPVESSPPPDPRAHGLEKLRERRRRWSAA